MHIVTIVGARPQFIKAATVSRKLRDARYTTLRESIIHTGQHYDHAMSDQFFQDLDIPPPLINLEAGSGSHAVQTGAIMARLETVISDIHPDLILVYGDTNSTLAAALVAAKAAVPLAHVEAGLRSFRPGMPEEVNRVVTDRLSEWLFCPTAAAAIHLNREGMQARTHVVGDVMFDSFRFYAGRPACRGAAARYGQQEKSFALVTLHRAENTDDPHRLALLFDALGRVANSLPIVLPLHPRTRSALATAKVKPSSGIHLLDPVSYEDMIGLTIAASVVATDSGGLQKEAFFAGTPCITLRDETEWIETVESGWNRLMPQGGAAIIADAVLDAAGNLPADVPALYGDGNAAGKILDILLGHQ